MKIKLSVVLLLAGIVIGYGFGHTTRPAAPTQTPVRVWTKADSLAYAKTKINQFAMKQYNCLANLWGKESAWDPSAYNKVKSMGMNAGGIPQVLGMSTLTPPRQQIDQGLQYIYRRYGMPCTAWLHWKKKGWY